jgi:hypothetical protein
MVDANNMVHSRIKKWLADKYQPNAAVFSSPAARELLKRQAMMTPAEFLRPFGDMSSQNFRTIITHERSNPYKLLKFKLNFVESSKMDPVAQKDSSMIFDYII